MTKRRSSQSLLQQGLDKRATSEADINHRIYVRPLGNTGLHIVKSRPTGAEYQVSGPTRTFVPGQSVPTGRHTGTQGETILIEPPPGKRGPVRQATTTVAPVATFFTNDGGSIPVAAVYPGFETQWNLETVGGLPAPPGWYELIECTNRAGTFIEGWSVIVEWSWVDDTSVNFTTTTIDSYTADGSESDPHPGFLVRGYNANGSLAGTSGRYWYEGV